MANDPMNTPLNSLNKAVKYSQSSGEAIDKIYTTLEDPKGANISEGLPDLEELTEEVLGGNKWPEIEAVAVELPKIKELTPDMLPLPFKDWIFDIADRMRCPVDYVAVSAICAVGALIGSRCGVKPKQKDNWTEVPNLWGAIVGSPSQLKSPSTSEVFKVFTPLENRAKAQFKEADRSARVRMQVLKEEEKQLLRKVGKEADTTEIENRLKEIEAEREELAVTLKRYRANDITPEKLADLCAENPQGIFVFRDELTGLLKSWEKQGQETARAFYLEAWNGKNPYTIDRVMKGTFFIPNLCVTVFGGIQPDKLQGYLYAMATGENDGFLQRLQLLVFPDERSYQYVDRYPDSVAKKQAQDVFTALDGFTDFLGLGAECSDYDKIPAFRFDDQAQEVFIDWFERLHHEKLEADDLSPYVKEHFAKYRSLMPCLSLIFHLINVAQSPQLYNGRIKKESALMAVKWCEYLESHANRIYNGLGKTKQLAAVELSKKISSGKLTDGFTARDVQRGNWHLLTDKEAINSALTELEECGWIMAEEANSNPMGGRPTVTYSINPQAHGFYQRKK